MSMFNLLLTTGVKGIDVPDSGIGPSTIISGNRELGYFGSFSLDQYDLYNKVLALIVDRSNFKEFKAEQDNEWLKFSIGGKSVYTTRRPIGIGLSYEELARSGMVLGTDTFVDGLESRQDAKINVVDNVSTHILIARLAVAYTGMGVDKVRSTFPVYTTPEALSAESNTIMNALGIEKAAAPSNSAIPGMGWRALAGPIAYFDSTQESRSAMAQELLHGRMRVNKVAIKAEAPDAPTPVEAGFRSIRTAFRPWLDLMALGVVPVGDLRNTAFSTDAPRAVVINSSDDPEKKPLLPSILLRANQKYIGPNVGKVLFTTTPLSQANQQFIGPFIKLPKPVA